MKPFSTRTLGQNVWVCVTEVDWMAPLALVLSSIVSWCSEESANWAEVL